MFPLFKVISTVALAVSLGLSARAQTYKNTIGLSLGTFRIRSLDEQTSVLEYTGTALPLLGLTYRHQSENSCFNLRALGRGRADEPQQPAMPFRDRFLVHVGQRLLPIDSSEVAYFYSSNKLTFLKTHTDNQYLLNYSLDELEKSLDPRQFYRANRQFIVSHKAVQKLHLYFNSKLKVDLRPVAEEDVMISREKAMAFRQWLDE